MKFKLVQLPKEVYCRSNMPCHGKIKKNKFAVCSTVNVAGKFVNLYYCTACFRKIFAEASMFVIEEINNLSSSDED